MNKLECFITFEWSSNSEVQLADARIIAIADTAAQRPNKCVEPSEFH